MRPPHYLTRDPVWGLPLVALVANLALVAFVAVQMHSARSKMRVSVAGPGQVAATVPEPPPVVGVTRGGEIILEGLTMTTPLDLEFRLESLASRSRAIIVRTAPDAPAATLARVFQACSNAGFADVLMDVEH